MASKIVFTWLGAALASAVVSFPLMVRAIRLAFQGVDPRFEMAARSLGASRLGAFFTIALPLARRGLIAGFMLAFARGLGEFGATIMVAGNIEGKTRTIPLAIYTLANTPDGDGRNMAFGGPLDLARLRGPGGQRVAGTEAAARCPHLASTASTSIRPGFTWKSHSTSNIPLRHCSDRRAAARRAS